MPAPRQTATKSTAQPKGRAFLCYFLVMTVRFRRVSVALAFVVGVVVGLFWLFMLSMALGLYTEFTPATRAVAYIMCPVLQLTFLFPGSWALMVLANGCLYAGLAFSLVQIVRRRTGSTNI